MISSTRREIQSRFRYGMMELWIMMVSWIFIEGLIISKAVVSTAIYEDESDNDLSMESHGSVVTHLLSQVKIGMDLTKVVLPTFILERRSLLEMYADYFAHPDLFIRIADCKDPRDRMVQVVRWYMSAYHAGRKSSVAKKPYNPIIGEVFRCHWNIPEFGECRKILKFENVNWVLKLQKIRTMNRRKLWVKGPFHGARTIN